MAARGERAVMRSVHVIERFDILRANYVNHSYALHAHETFALGVIESGACAVRYGGATEMLTAGAIVTIDPGEPHTGVAVAGGWSYRALYPGEGVMRAVAASIAGRDVPAPNFGRLSCRDDVTAAKLVRLHAMLEAGADSLAAESALHDALGTLLRRHASPRAARIRSCGNRRAVARVREYLEASATRVVTLRELCALVDLSPYHLIRLFRSATGLPPYTYLEQLRVARAKALLRSGVPVAQVAHVTGFSDQSHLTRRFKRVVGVPPAHYARSQRAALQRPISFIADSA